MFNRTVFKVVGTHALIVGVCAAAATVIVDMLTLATMPED